MYFSEEGGRRRGALSLIFYHRTDMYPPPAPNDAGGAGWKERREGKGRVELPLAGVDFQAFHLVQQRVLLHLGLGQRHLGSGQLHFQAFVLLLQQLRMTKRRSSGHKEEPVSVKLRLNNGLNLLIVPS